MNSVGAHCYDHNHNTVGICFVGDYERAVPTGAALSSGVLLMAYICKTYGIKPGPETILGHKDLMILFARVRICMPNWELSERRLLVIVKLLFNR